MPIASPHMTFYVMTIVIFEIYHYLRDMRNQNMLDLDLDI